MSDRIDEALSLTRVERGRDLSDGEIAYLLANHQTSIRHGTAQLGIEIAAQLRDRLERAAPSPALTREALAAALVKVYGPTIEPSNGRSPEDDADAILAALSGTPAERPVVVGVVVNGDGE